MKSLILVLIISIFVPLQLFSQMAGTYTIGATGCDYSMISTAVASLKSLGVNAPVVFVIKDGIYKDNFSIDSINGTSSTNTVTFLSESNDSTKVVVQDSTSSLRNYVCQFNGCSYVLLKSITVRPLTNNSWATVINFRNESKHNTISNCIIEGVKRINQCSGGLSSLINEENTYINMPNINDNNSVINNVLLYGTEGVYLHYCHDFKIIGNRFADQSNSALHVDNGYSIVFEHNYITNKHKSLIYTAIFAEYCDVSIRYNDFILRTGDAGILINNCQSYSGSLISNNFICLANDSLSEHAGNLGGIIIKNSRNIKVINNSIHIMDSNLPCFMLSDLPYYSASSNLVVLNNIFSKNTSSIAIIIDSTKYFTSFDYNTYSNDSMRSYCNNYYNGLAAWQSFTGFDQHSFAADPLFVSDTNLHIQQPLINGKGLASALVVDDYDGELRDNLHPDIGADEFCFSAVADFSVNSAPNGILISNTSVNYDSLQWSINGFASEEENLDNVLRLPGIYEVCLIAYGFCENDTICKSVEVIGDITGIDRSIVQLVTVYPNPASDEIIISDASGYDTAKIYSSLGLLINIIKINGNRERLDVSGYKSGLYLIHFENLKSNEILKFLVE
ncbi:MAG: T9SS type A sorting domain-containing protein [Bacteroidota bacterium]